MFMFLLVNFRIKKVHFTSNIYKYFFIISENIAEKKKTEELRRKLDEKREKRKIDQKLAQVKTIAQTADEEDDDAANWVEKMRRVQLEKEAAAKRAKILEEMDQEFGVGDLVTQELMKQKTNAYTAKNLRGLKVEHDRVRCTLLIVLIHCINHFFYYRTQLEKVKWLF